jgi:hypothetical protein
VAKVPHHHPIVVAIVVAAIVVVVVVAIVVVVANVVSCCWASCMRAADIGLERSGAATRRSKAMDL